MNRVAVLAIALYVVGAGAGKGILALSLSVAEGRVLSGHRVGLISGLLEIGIVPDILEGNIEPGRVFDKSVGLDGVPDGYRAMADRESIKVLVRP